MDEHKVRNYRTLNRQSLYDLVWARPMVQVAKDFGITDVALAKRCKAVNVPIPYRGYWARVAAGQTPPTIPLPKYRNQDLAERALAVRPMKPEMREGDEPSVNFGVPDPATLPAPKVTPELPPDEAAMAERIAALGLKPKDAIEDMHGVAKRTAVKIGLAKVSKLPWSRAERAGTIVSAHVSVGTRVRAVAVIDLLIRSSEALGWKFIDAMKKEPDRNRYGYRLLPPNPEPREPGILSVDDELVELRIDEPNRQVPHVLTAEEKRPKRPGDWISKPPPWDLVPSGRLKLTFMEVGSRYPRGTWTDRVKATVEDQVPAVLLALHRYSLKKKADRLEAEAAAARQKLLDEQRERRRQRRSANRKLAHEFERQAGAWHRAQFLRRYLRAAKRAGVDFKTELRGKPVSLMEWAATYIEEIDPLSPARSVPDLRVGAVEKWNGFDSEKLKADVARIVGHAWMGEGRGVEVDD